MGKRLILAITFLLHCAVLSAQVPVIQPDLSKPTKISPNFFGPNCFQVPEMTDGRIGGNFSVEIAGDFFAGHLVPGDRDRTFDLAARIRIPLFSQRVRLSLWMPICEWYDFGPRVKAARRVSDDVSGKGRELGPAFISTDIQLVEESQHSWKPSVALRIALRTASEDKAFASARSYDSAGYFFDLTASKGFGPFRVAVSTGFLCWQTDNGRQNDAVMYGLLGSYNCRYFAFSAQFGGYCGWEGIGDRPCSLRARIDLGNEKWDFRPVISYQHGFNDWPFDQFRIGVKYSLNKKKKQQ